jgi:hypothetical protein
MGCIVILAIYWVLGNTIQYRPMSYGLIQYAPLGNTIILRGFHIANIRIVYIIRNTDDDQDISNFLPPPNPPVQPTTERTSFDDDEPVKAASVISSSGAPEVDSVDSSQSLLTANPQPPGDIKERAMPSIGTLTDAVDSVSISNHESPEQVQDVAFDTTLETSSQLGNDELDPVGHLAQELAEQLVKFQGCCNDCRRVAQRNHMEDPNEHISLLKY